MPPRRRAIEITDWAGQYQAAVTDEQLSMIKACIWNPRPFELVLTNGVHILFSRALRLEVFNRSDEVAVRHVLLPRPESSIDKPPKE